MTNFDKSIAFVLKWEGGYVNDPKDPGGETRFGISKRSYPMVDIVRLTVDKAKEIYRQDYWDAMDCDEYEWPLCLVIFDTAVNLGVGRCRRFVAALKGTDKAKAEQLIKIRTEFYHRIAVKKVALRRFLKGWLNRINDLKKVSGLQ